MALSTLVLVGESRGWLLDIVGKAEQSKVNGGNGAGAYLGPVISKYSQDRIGRLIQGPIDDGQTLLLDGRGYKPKKHPNGMPYVAELLCTVSLAPLLNLPLGDSSHNFDCRASYAVLH
jgi:acyl-CoA reductase-like NAD-dependent aldehyde dehydrogenase